MIVLVPKQILRKGQNVYLSFLDRRFSFKERLLVVTKYMYTYIIYVKEVFKYMSINFVIEYIFNIGKNKC